MKRVFQLGTLIKKSKNKKQNNEMKKDLFKVHLLSLAGLLSFVLTFASCANEDAVQKKADVDNDNDKNLTTFSTGIEPESRTSMDYNSGAFYWEAGDYIYVKDDDGIWRKSKNAPTAKTAYFNFKVDGNFNNSDTYKVYYPGKDHHNNEGSILINQTQTEPNSTTHFGESGDCGMADATGTIGGKAFSFRLNHQAAYLVFQPYTNDVLLQECYLTKIEVISDNNIAGTYTLDPITKKLTGTGTDKTITLTTKAPSGTYVNGFPMTTTSASLSTNGAYMVIAPGYHRLRIRYWLRSKRYKEDGSLIEGTVTKDLPTFNYEANNYYDMAANLTITHYPGNVYYTWDAQQPYWDGYEWDNPVTSKRQQPTPLFYNPDAYNYAPKAASDPRYYNPLMGYNDPTGAAPAVLPTTTRFQACPNVNELLWYAKKGNPYSDTELWACMGVVETGGMWFLKKRYISNFDKNHAPDETTDYTRSLTFLAYETPVSTGMPAANELNKYFFLPCAGCYMWTGSLTNFGRNGFYWSSTPFPSTPYQAYVFNIIVNNSNAIAIRRVDTERSTGYRVDWPADR